MNKPKLKQVNVMLDQETVRILNDYSYQKFGKTNVSLAIRHIAKELIGSKNDRNES